MDENGQGAIESASVAVTPTENTTPTERTFRQTEVNDLVKRVKHEAVEDYRRLQDKQPQYAEQKYGSQQQENRTQNAMPETEVRRMAAEEAQRLRDEWVNDAQSRSEQDNAQRIVKSFWDKISTGKDKYEDFDKITGDIEYARFPNVVQLLAEHMDNADDMLYELGKDRFKMSQLEQLSQMSPKDAMVQAKRLSDSIRNNAQARNVRTPNSPLSQQRPSNVGTDGGAMTMANLKAKYRA